MEIQLGKPVFSSDDQQIGSVNRLVIDSDSRELVEIIVHQGLVLTKDRIVERQFIDRVDADGVVWLMISAQEANRLPIFVAQEYVVAHEGNPLPNAEEASLGPTIAASGLQYGSSSYEQVLWTTHPIGRDIERIDDTPFFIQAPSAPQPSGVLSNIPAGFVSVNKGTDVIAADGRKVGHIEEVVSGDTGEIENLIVRTGLLRHGYVTVPVEKIATLGQKTVRLALTAEEIVTLEPGEGPRNLPVETSG